MCMALCSSTACPTAPCTAHYLVTLGGIRALHDLHLEQRIALIGFDDIALADVVRPVITVMAADPTRLGTIAAERIRGASMAKTTCADRRRRGQAHPPRFWRLHRPTGNSRECSPRAPPC